MEHVVWKWNVKLFPLDVCKNFQLVITNRIDLDRDD